MQVKSDQCLPLKCLTEHLCGSANDGELQENVFVPVLRNVQSYFREKGYLLLKLLSNVSEGDIEWETGNDKAKCAEREAYPP